MAEIARYDITDRLWSSITEIVPCKVPDGEWVRYADHARIVGELAEKTGELYARIAELEAKITVLKEALAVATQQAMRP
jgi:hypothetical protein